MKKIILSVLAIVLFIQVGIAQDKVASQLYNNKGKKVKYKKMIKDLAESDMVFFGEYHTNPISHWMQLEMTMSFFDIKGEKLF